MSARSVAGTCKRSQRRSFIQARWWDYKVSRTSRLTWPARQAQRAPCWRRSRRALPSQRWQAALQGALASSLSPCDFKPCTFSACSLSSRDRRGLIETSSSPSVTTSLPIFATGRCDFSADELLDDELLLPFSVERHPTAPPSRTSAASETMEVRDIRAVWHEAPASGTARSCIPHQRDGRLMPPPDGSTLIEFVAFRGVLQPTLQCVDAKIRLKLRALMTRRLGFLDADLPTRYDEA